MENRERKYSRQRDAILEVIRSTASHPGALWVYERLKPRLPGLSLGTVYRNITFFRKEGLVVSLGVVNGEERFDGDAAPHPHVVCRCCGRVADLPCAEASGIPEVKTEGNPGFIIDYRRTVYYGLCSRCAGEGAVVPPVPDVTENCGLCR
jgi:Fur family peroxide stress response transcriptional regulator